MFHPKAIFRIIGFLLLFEALSLLSCIPVALYYGEPTEYLLLSVAAMVVSGSFFAYVCRKAGRNVSRRYR